MAKLYFYYSAMNAGKTTTLLQSSYNYHERGMRTLLFSPKIDDRFAQGAIHSRIGLNAESISFDDQFDFFAYVEHHLRNPQNALACILVDEAQFLNKAQVKQLTEITDRLSIPVLCYGLRSDFRGEPFEGSLYLLIWADELNEIKTICHCGRKAIMNLRVDQAGNKVTDGPQVHIAGNETFLSTCRLHYKMGQSQTSQKN